MFISYTQLLITNQMIHKYTTIVLIFLPYTKIKIYGKTRKPFIELMVWIPKYMCELIGYLTKLKVTYCDEKDELMN
jgi:hypothetical protein